MNQFNRLDAILKRTGEWYVTIMIAVSQIIGLFGAIPGLVSLYFSVELGRGLGQSLLNLVPFLVILSQAIILIICWQITPNARNQISMLNFGATQTEKEKEKEFAAWTEITNLPSQYGIIAFCVYAIVSVAVPFARVFFYKETVLSILQPLTANSPFPVYILLGGLAAALGTTLFSMFFIGRLTIPVRMLLLPSDFEDQLKGRTGALLGSRFQIINLSLIFIAIAVIVPVGYQQLVRILYENVDPSHVLGTLQAQLLILSILVLVLGAGFSFFSLQSIAGPVTNLIDVLQKMEQGDLTQRVPVLATDELATVAVRFNRMVVRLEQLQSSLEGQVSERTRQLAATNEVGRVAASILNPEELLGKVVNLITERFNYYYAAIYLLDPSEKWAELKEATGQTGDVLKQNRHRLEVAGRSMVAVSIRERTPQIVQNTSEEKQRADNPLLPYTRSEIALPLMIGNRVLGALDVQSTKPSDFGVGIIETMQNMAIQVAVALENAHLFQEAQQSISELRAIQKQYLQEGWNSIKSYNEELEYVIGDVTDAEHQKLESAINLREQVLGQITLEGSEEWTPEQRSLVDAVAAQTAVALENARLVSESRQIAMRERTLTEINSKIWSSPSIDSILQNVIKELGRRLDASNATIELNLDDNS